MASSDRTPVKSLASSPEDLDSPGAPMAARKRRYGEGNGLHPADLFSSFKAHVQTPPGSPVDQGTQVPPRHGRRGHFKRPRVDGTTPHAKVNLSSRFVKAAKDEAVRKSDEAVANEFIRLQRDLGLHWFMALPLEKQAQLVVRAAAARNLFVLNTEKEEDSE